MANGYGEILRSRADMKRNGRFLSFQPRPPIGECWDGDGFAEMWGPLGFGAFASRFGSPRSCSPLFQVGMPTAPTVLGFNDAGARPDIAASAAMTFAPASSVVRNAAHPLTNQMHNSRSEHDRFTDIWASGKVGVHRLGSTCVTTFDFFGRRKAAGRVSPGSIHLRHTCDAVRNLSFGSSEAK